MRSLVSFVSITEAGFASKDEHLMTRQEACNDPDRANCELARIAITSCSRLG